MAGVCCGNYLSTLYSPKRNISSRYMFPRDIALPTTNEITDRLFELRNRYGAAQSGEKLRLLKAFKISRRISAKQLKKLHAGLCFIRAFPDSRKHYRLATKLLDNFSGLIAKLPSATRRRLDDSGIAGTRIHYRKETMSS
ncbi:MAG: hypothetical protein O6844_00250 [Gammaproteobacteria bacterium]|nr:hypothetical protein [Gammaproteobacteria bacterium]MCZ6826423.1 hypothetical protein [Gammaproteobacteria bacterium]MCZ6911584.1 hypothetical protein [Pseudomonadota bacterium]